MPDRRDPYFRIFYDSFCEEILPYVRGLYEADGIRDIPARREAWNDYLDSWVRDGEIPEYAADRIGGLPDYLE